jgi:ADP-dependent phosphofructokinase/glucokinase
MMKIFLGLFAHWDSVVKLREGFRLPGGSRKPSPGEKVSDISEVGYLLEQGDDAEFLITERLYNEMKKLFPERERRPGGNAVNAAIALGELGKGCVLSCPIRPKGLMMSLAAYPIRVVQDGATSSPLKAAFGRDEFEHMCFEMKDRKKIFTYDTMTEECWLDKAFWESVKSADFLYLCGFHLVTEAHKPKIDYVSDLLQGRGFRTHLELGHGTDTIRYAIRKLVDRGCIDSIGMNEGEASLLGIAGGPADARETAREFLRSSGVQRLAIHTKEYRLTVFRGDPGKNLRAAEYSRQAAAARTLGNIKENMEKAKTLSLTGTKAERGRDYVLLPVYSNTKPKAVVGLGDMSSVIDAMVAFS